MLRSLIRRARSLFRKPQGSANIEALRNRGKILRAEQAISEMPGAMKNDCFPLKHNFADGMYVREINVPAGSLLVTKIHKVAHPYFMLKGECSIFTEQGPVRIKAPFYGITPAGTKRIIYVHEDCVWVTCHVTEEQDLQKIENEIIAKSYDEVPLPEYVKDFIKLNASEGEKLCLG